MQTPIFFQPLITMVANTIFSMASDLELMSKESGGLHGVTDREKLVIFNSLQMREIIHRANVVMAVVYKNVPLV
jgi:hypothetical protein